MPQPKSTERLFLKSKTFFTNDVSLHRCQKEINEHRYRKPMQKAVLKRLRAIKDCEKLTTAEICKQIVEIHQKQIKKRDENILLELMKD